VVTDRAEEKLGFRRAAEHIFLGVGSAIAGTVYGTVVVMATLTAAYATETHPWKLAVIVMTTAFVLWIAHVYAHGLSKSIHLNRRLRRADVADVLRSERGVLLAAVPPAAALLLGAIGLFRESTAVWIALGLGLATLAIQGVRYARLEHLSPLGTAVATAGNLALGLLVVLLKVAIAH
jgi:hypothetical protein